MTKETTQKISNKVSVLVRNQPTNKCGGGEDFLTFHHCIFNPPANELIDLPGIHLKWS